jgi:hypothetical protein
MFLNFRREKIGVFLENQCYGPFVAKTSSWFEEKNANFFSPNLSAKIFLKL